MEFSMKMNDFFGDSVRNELKLYKQEEEQIIFKAEKNLVEFMREKFQDYRRKKLFTLCDYIQKKVSVLNNKNFLNKVIFEMFNVKNR